MREGKKKHRIRDETSEQSKSCAMMVSLYKKECVILWPVQCNLHPGCGGGSAGGLLAADGTSAGTSGS